MNPTKSDLDSTFATDAELAAPAANLALARIHAFVANTAAITAIAAADRTDGMLVVDDATSCLWKFDAESVVGATSKILAPDAGTGRWIAVETIDGSAAKAVTDALVLTTNGNGASRIGIEDAGLKYVATDVEAALAEVKALADAGMPVLKKTVDVVFGDLAAGVVNGASVAINIGTAPAANARIVGVDVRLATPFTGGGASAVALDVGTAGDPDALVDGADVFAAAVDGQASTCPAGIAPHKKVGATQLIATFTPDGGAALAGLTAGACTVDVLYTVLD